MIVYGINPVLEALRSGRARRVRVGGRGDQRIEEALTLARAQGVAIERADRQTMDRVTAGGVHQGIVAEIDAPRDYSLSEIVAAAAPAAPLIVVLDGIEDPHNFGAIHRLAIGLAGEAHERYDAVDFTLPSAVVLGAEGTGLRRLVQERCDRLVAIPMHGAVASLNVSVAAGVVLYEAARQRGWG